MKSKKNLVLLGMMGSGKSTIGRLISKKLNFKFFDIDKIIEKQTNMEISEIFQKKGEIFFREIEKKLSIKFLYNKNCVISLGGGAFIDHLIRKQTKSKSITFWLANDFKTTIARIRKRTNRPIAQSLNDDELKELIKKRSKIYSKANYKINCKDLDKNKIVEKILKIYENS